MVRQWSAKPSSPVRIGVPPPFFSSEFPLTAIILNDWQLEYYCRLIFILFNNRYANVKYIKDNPNKIISHMVLLVTVYYFVDNE